MTPPKPPYVGGLHLDDSEIWSVDCGEAETRPTEAALLAAVREHFKEAGEAASLIPAFPLEAGKWAAWYHRQGEGRAVWWTGA